VAVLISALIIAAAIGWGCAKIAMELKAARSEAGRARTLELLKVFAGAAEAAVSDPRAVLAWEPLARAARRLVPDAFAELDRAAGGPFPLGPERIQAAHAQWTADWLAWERAHDAEYKVKAAALQEEATREGSPAPRARLDLIEREKLDVYQRRYQEYVRVAKALQALTEVE
jgi:hypothetical protein